MIAGVGTVPWAALWDVMKLAVAAALAGVAYRMVTMDCDPPVRSGFLVVGTIILRRDC